MNNRQYILNEIRTSSDWITSESLCHKLDISRMAVSKHVNTLRQMGYDIQTAQRKGYLFKSAPDRLYPEEIQYHLETEVIGKDIQYYESTDSTNIRAKEAALNHCPEGTVFIAETQTAGRGRRGRSWYSGKKDACALSIIIRPRFSPRQLSLIPLLTAVAVAEAIEHVTGLTPQVKWPNDLLIGRKKICGILTEAGFDLETIDYAVIGIGLNVNTPANTFPPEICSIATSLAAEADQNYNRATLVRHILQTFEQAYIHAVANGFDDVIEKWHIRNCTLGQSVTIHQESGDISGKALELTPEGGLLLKLPNGQKKVVMSGDVTLL